MGSYSIIADVTVSEVPDWALSDNYLAGASKVAEADAIIDVLKTSFDYLFVDEYQDCTLVLHEFVLALAAAIPKTVLLEDELQAIFTFVGPMATWDGHVLPGFSAYDLEVDHTAGAATTPRSSGSGSSTPDPQLVHGQTFDFADHQVPGLQFIPGTGPTALAGRTLLP